MARKLHQHLQRPQDLLPTQRTIILPQYVRVILMSAAILIGSGLGVAANAATYYLSPSGSDANAGTSSSAPWKTFKFAIPKLLPGDTLALLDGTYTTATHGDVRITCSAGGNAKSGIQGKPITLKATNQRKAALKNDGVRRSVVLSGCSWWVIDGLTIQSQDNASYLESGTLINLNSGSHHNIVRDTLLYNINRYAGGGGIIAYGSGSTDNLIEGNELYNFDRNGIYSLSSYRNTFRRNYCNGADSRGADPKVTGPHVCFDLYYSEGSLYENNVAENSDGCFSIGGAKNRALGNISINCNNGILVSKHPQEGKVVSDNIIENHIAVGGPKAVNGLFSRSVLNLLVKNFSSFGGSGSGIAADNPYDPRQGPGKCSPYIPNGPCTVQQDPGLTVRNSLVFGTSGGYIVNQANQFDIRIFEYSLGWQNPNGTWRAGTETRQMATTPPAGVATSPDIGTCRVFIPSTSTLKKVGAGGANIGANVLYRYENGTLTNKPLWDPQSGQFPCGAIIPGVNNGAGASCFDVHKRLNVNVNGCALPADYGQQSVVLAAPTNLRVMGGD